MMKSLSTGLVLGLFAVCSLAQEFPDRPTMRIDKAKASWIIPNEDADGKPLNVNDIGGYEIYLYNTAQPVGSEQTIDIPDGSQKEYDFNLPPGEYAAAIAAYHISGVYAERSEFTPFTITQSAGPATTPIQIETVPVLGLAADWCIGSEKCALEINIAIR